MKTTWKNLITWSGMTALAMGVFGCSDDGDDMVSAPEISSFTASAATVAQGGTAELSWSVKNADTITIESSASSEAIYAGSDAMGMITTPAIDGDTEFTIRAEGPGGTKTQAIMIALQVADPDVAIVRFAATPAMIAAGEETKLQWEINNATAFKIDIMNGANVLSDSTDFTAELAVTPAETTVYVLTAEGPGGPVQASATVMVDAPLPVIASFQAMPNTILTGESTQLAWMVSNADTIKISDGAGTALYAGTEANGTVDVTPSMTEIFTLEATNESGSTNSTVMVTVNVPPSAVIDDFSASPDTIGWGRASTLSWSVRNAPDGVQIIARDAAGETTVTETSEDSGSVDVMPLETTEYTLTAMNEAHGDAVAMARITVNPVAPEVIAFDASENPTGVGSEITISWQTIGADQIILTEVEPGSDELLNTTDMTGMGTFTYTVTATQTVFNLMASNPAGGTNQQLTVLAEDAADFMMFTVAPMNFIGTTTTATITWDAANATSTELRINGMADAGFPGTAAGTYSFEVVGTAEIELIALSLGGDDSQMVTIRPVSMEAPGFNDTSSTAVAWPTDGSSVFGTIDPAADADWYAFDISDGGNISARTSTFDGRCTIDTVLRLYDQDGTTILVENDDFGGRCSRFEAQDQTAAHNLPAGTYFIEVTSYSGFSSFDYVLHAEVGAAACGNGMIETTTFEQCDDGNNDDGDGCTAACTFEAAGQIQAPGIDQTISGADLAATTYWEIVMNADGYIRAEAGSPALGACDEAIDLELIGENGEVRMGTGFGCQTVDMFEDGQGPFEPGLYYLAITPRSVLVAAYEIAVSTRGTGCGNGILETAGTGAVQADEACDDGNLLNGDGCDNQCTFEGIEEIEGQTNVVTSTPATHRGAIMPAGDTDLYEVMVPAGHHLVAWMSVDSVDSCPLTPTGALRLLDTDGTTEMASNRDGGLDGNCGRIAPNTTDAAFEMAGGTYYIEVSAFGGASEIGTYLLNVEIVAPGCGNSYFEPSIGEQCDDSNLDPTDACNEMCQWNIEDTILPPGGTVILDLPALSGRMIQMELTADGQSVTATTSDPGADTCETNTRMFLLDSAFETIQDQRSGPTGVCAGFSAYRDDFARGLTAGTYYLFVVNEGETDGQTQLDVQIVDEGCGNGLHEEGESCDDFNGISGDGCSALCEIEPDGFIFMGGMSTATVSDSIAAPGDFLMYQVEVSSVTLASFMTSTPTIGAGGCTSPDDTTLTLYEDDGRTEVATNDDSSGLGYCSRMEGLRLEPGTYYLRIGTYQNRSAIAALDMVATSVPADVCGNGIVEPENAEICDDGNQIGGDGCSAICESEATIIPETEPNDDAATANDLIINSGDFIVGGSIGLTTDGETGDFFFVTVPAGETRALSVRTHGDVGDLETCNGDTRLWIYDAAIETDSEAAALAENDDGGNGVCSSLAITLEADAAAPTRFYIRIAHYSGGGASAPTQWGGGAFGYYASISLQ